LPTKAQLTAIHSWRAMAFTTLAPGTIKLWGKKLYHVGLYPVQRISETVHKSTRLYRWEKGNMHLILQGFHPSEHFPFGGAFSPALPLFSTGAGKAILAWLTDAEPTDYIEKTKLHPFTANTISDKKLLKRYLREICERLPTARNRI